MPKRFEVYRMRDGVTPLSEDFFNQVFGDIDTRIAELEARRADWQGVVNELTTFGLQRIDTLVGPSMAEVNAMLQQLRERRDELEAAIGNVGDLITENQLAAAMEAEQAERTEAIEDAVNTAATAEAQARAAAFVVEREARALDFARATAKPSAAVYTYNAASRVATVVETLPEGERQTTITYNAAGRVASVAVAYGGKTRTTTYGYDTAGRVNGFEAVEV